MVRGQRLRGVKLSPLKVACQPQDKYLISSFCKLGQRFTCKLFSRLLSTRCPCAEEGHTPASGFKDWLWFGALTASRGCSFP